MKSIQTFLVGLITIFLLQTCYKIDDYEPPIIQVILPESGAKLIDSLEVICLATDDGEVEYVEMWIDGEYDDRAEDVPYSFMLYAEDFEDKSNHVITARAYDDDGDYADSGPVYFEVCYFSQDTSMIDTSGIQTLEKGHFIYLASSNNQIYRYNLNKDKLELIVSDYRAAHPHYMKEINKIGYRSYGSYHMSIMDLDGNNQHAIYDLSTNTVVTDYCSKTLIFYGYNMGNPKRIVTIDIENNEFKYITDPQEYEDSGPAVNEEGSHLVFVKHVDGSKQLYLMDLIDYSIKNLQFESTFNKFHVKWSNLKNGFYFIEQQSVDKFVLKYYSLDTFLEEEILSEYYVFRVAFSPDEKLIAMLIRTEDNVQNLFIYNRENEELDQKTFVDFRLFHEEWVEVK